VLVTNVVVVVLAMERKSPTLETRKKLMVGKSGA